MGVTKKLFGACFAAVAIFLCGCTITKNVKPVAAGTKIQSIYLTENQDVLYKQSLLDILQEIIQGEGFEAKQFRGEMPTNAVHHLAYQANWNWDLAMYLTYFHATLFEGDKILGEVEYDARKGGSNFAKFGTTANKIRPLLVDLLKNVERSEQVKVIEVSAEAGK